MDVFTRDLSRPEPCRERRSLARSRSSTNWKWHSADFTAESSATSISPATSTSRSRSGPRPSRVESPACKRAPASSLTPTRHPSSSRIAEQGGCSTSRHCDRQRDESTGLEGDRAVDAAVASITPSPWPVFAIAIGALVIVAAIWILASSRAWPGASRRYDAPTGNDGTPASTPSVEPTFSTVSDWDSLSAGEDPTGTPDAR
jgi:hypothetical protein